MKTSIKTRLAALAALLPAVALLNLLPVGRAFADEYEPVGAGAAVARVATDPNPFVVGAYGFIWVALVLYVVSVARGLARANAEIADLRRRVAAAGGEIKR